MGFPYPRASNWVRSKRNRDGTYTLKDGLHGDVYTLGSTIGYLWRRLDGKRDPADILPGYRQETIDFMLQELDRSGLIRHSRVLEKSFGSITYSLIIPRRRFGSRLLPVILNALLFLLWCPALVLGCYLFCKNLFLFDNTYAFPGQLAGLLAGCICHEAAHAIGGLATGAGFLEAGVLIHRFLPGAYVLLDESSVKRLPRVQIHAAGVEANFLLCGVGLMLASAFPGCYGFFFGTALSNLLLGLINLTFIDGLDGMHIIETLLGFSPLDVVRSREMRKALKKEGLPGKLELLVSYILKVIQVAYPALLILNVLEIIIWVVFVD